MRITWYRVLDLVMVSVLCYSFGHWLVKSPSYSHIFLLFYVASTRDEFVFSFYPDHRPSHGFEEALSRYREIVPCLTLSGYTLFILVSFLCICWNILFLACIVEFSLNELLFLHIKRQWIIVHSYWLFFVFIIVLEDYKF